MSWRAYLQEEGECYYRVVKADDKAMQIIRRITSVDTSTTAPHGQKIHCLDIMYLIHNYSSRLIIIIDGIILDSLEKTVKLFSSKYDDIWPSYEVYLDLRRRGRIVRPGLKPGTLVLLDKKTRKITHYILVLQQNVKIRMTYIKSFIEEALKNGWEPVTAIIDYYGDITYYTSRQLTVAQGIGQRNKEKPYGEG